MIGIFLSSSLLWIENEDGKKEYKNASLCFLFIENTGLNERHGSKLNILSFRDDIVRYETISAKCISHSLQSTLLETRQKNEVTDVRIMIARRLSEKFKNKRDFFN